MEHHAQVQMRPEKIRGRGVDRLLDVFDAMERADQPMTVSDLARGLGAPNRRSTCLSICWWSVSTLRPCRTEGFSWRRFGRLEWRMAAMQALQSSRARRWQISQEAQGDAELLRDD